MSKLEFTNSKTKSYTKSIYESIYDESIYDESIYDESIYEKYIRHHGWYRSMLVTKTIENNFRNSIIGDEPFFVINARKLPPTLCHQHQDVFNVNTWNSNFKCHFKCNFKSKFKCNFLKCHIVVRINLNTVFE